MTVSRRNALVFLGLAGPTSAALATEQMVHEDLNGAEPGHGHLPQLGRIDSDKIADVLQRLVDGLRSRHVVPELGQNNTVLSVVSRISHDNWLQQELTLSFYVTEPDQPYGRPSA